MIIKNDVEIMLIEEFQDVEFLDEEISAFMGIIACCMSIPCK